ncbi:hypothetical protein HYR54_07575 [Candidatus Acetothermia bacterium]|nr:hypothetical protein [Candidatus Acetothermia bacterium]MBI3660135.1 hypothetical protein [Candidatus Acetothermia bacterium]
MKKILCRGASLGFCVALLIFLGGCEGTFQASLAISHSFISVGGTGKVRIAIVNPPDAKTLQIGPTGKFTFNPAIISVTAVKGLNGFQVFASTTNNVTGEVRFAAGFPGGSIRPIMNMGVSNVQIDVIEIIVQAVGVSGSSSLLNITSVDVCTDRNGKDIIVTGIQAGEVTIQ